MPLSKMQHQWFGTVGRGPIVSAGQPLDQRTQMLGAVRVEMLDNRGSGLVQDTDYLSLW